jgi:hypothetical protein
MTPYKANTLFSNAQSEHVNTHGQAHPDQVVDVAISRVLCPLDQNEAMADAALRACVEEALRDTRPPIPASAVYARLEERHVANSKNSQ